MSEKIVDTTEYAVSCVRCPTEGMLLVPTATSIQFLDWYCKECTADDIQRLEGMWETMTNAREQFRQASNCETCGYPFQLIDDDKLLCSCDEVMEDGP